jgi:hypothetical protein
MQLHVKENAAEQGIHSSQTLESHQMEHNKVQVLTFQQVS